jgi:iron complex outermembrane receptor protein
MGVLERVRLDARAQGWIVVFAVAALAVPAHAQVPPTAAPAGTASPDSMKEMHEVNVTDTEVNDSYTAPDATTATKTDTPIMETPVSVQVISRQVLLDQGARGLNEALTNVSGVFTVGLEPGQESITIRGFNTTATLWNGFRIDEYSTTGGGTVGAVLIDNAEKVEVLKGPAGTMYGRVEPGGMINVITKQPQREFYGAAALMLGSWRHDWAGVDLTGPVNEDKTVLYRLNASQEYSDSWLWRNSFRSVAAAPVVEWRLSPSTRVSLEGQFRHDTATGGTSAVPVDPASGLLYPTLPQYTPLIGASTFDLSRVYLHLTHQFNDDWSVSAKLLHTLTADPVYTYSYITQAYFPPNGPNDLTIDRAVSTASSRNRTDATMLDLVGHLSTLGLRHTVLFGADYYHTPITFGTNAYSCCYTTNYFNPAPLPSNAAFIPAGPNGSKFNGDLHQSSRDYGVYFQDQVKLPASVHLLMGMRYQHYVYTSDSESAIGGPFVSSPPQADHAFTPRAGVLWRPQDWLSVYYSYAQNFGINSGFAIPHTPLPPENARQNEVGMKTEFYGGRLTSSLTLYELVKTNIAAADPNHQGFNISIGEVRSKGYEYDLQGEVTPGWDAIANFSYVQPYVVVGGQSSSTTYVAGHLMPGVPEYMFNVWTTYKLPQQGLKGWKIGAGANWRASSAYPGSVLETPAYWLASLVTSYEHRFGAYKGIVQLNVNNVLNKFYYNNFYLVLANNYTDLNYGNPREYRLSLRIEF